MVEKAPVVVNKVGGEVIAFQFLNTPTERMIVARRSRKPYVPIKKREVHVTLTNNDGTERNTTVKTYSRIKTALQEGLDTLRSSEPPKRHLYRIK